MPLSQNVTLNISDPYDLKILHLSHNITTYLTQYDLSYYIDNVFNALQTSE